MPITPFLNGEPFDPESRRVLRVALEMVCIALRTGDCDEGVQQAIAKKLIALVKAGERNPDILCEEALKDIRQPQQWAASEAARSSVLGKQKLVRNTGPAEALPRRPPFTLQLRHGGRNPATTLAQWRGFPWARTGQACHNAPGVAP